MDIENKVYDENQRSFAQQAARASLLAPFIAIGLNICTIPLTSGAVSQKMVIGSFILLIILAGSVGAVIGLCGVKKLLNVSKRRGSDLLIISVIGLILNGALIYLAISAAILVHNKMGTVTLSVTPPKGYKEFPEGRKQFENVFCAYRKGDPNDDKPDLYLVVIDLGGTVTKEDKLENVLKSLSEVTIFKEDWKGHQIEVARTEEEVEGTPLVSFDALVPTAPQAMLVKLAGPRDREKEIKKDLKKILNGMKGQSNW